jgi:hypothetical protein
MRLFGSRVEEQRITGENYVLTSFLIWAWGKMDEARSSETASTDDPTRFQNQDD